MKVSCTGSRNLVMETIKRLIAGVVLLLWLARWFTRLMPRAVGGEGVYAWSDLAERAYRVVDRCNE